MFIIRVLDQSSLRGLVQAVAISHPSLRGVAVAISKRQKRQKRQKGWLGQFIDSDFPYVSLVPYVPCVPITLSPFVTLVTLPPPPVTLLHCYTCYIFGLREGVLRVSVIAR